MSTGNSNQLAQQHSPEPLRIGAKAPGFKVSTTLGTIDFNEYRKDSWVILFSHPADFTPVCTTELVAFSQQKDWFTNRETKLIGVSVDSIHSHLAWVQNVKEKTGVEFNFPIVADVNKTVADLYGMIHPDASSTATVRTVFIIDPEGIIRLIITYPLNVGRNIEEIKRVVTALQIADSEKVATPANWKPGEKVIVPPPKSLSDIEANTNTGYERIDFYLQKKELAIQV